MEKKPNFIIVYCDDLGYGDLGCYGSETAKTPHIDQIAENGVRFTNWYSDSPVCSPSRASLLTGRYPAKTGVDKILIGRRGTKGILQGVKTVAEIFKENGYSTAIFGKWHLGSTTDNVPNAHGFDEFFGFHSGCVDYYSHIFYWAQAKGVNPVHDLWHNREEIWDDSRYMTEMITEKAVQYIDQQAEEPFFMYVPYNAPHYPMHAPHKYLERFPDLPWDRKIMAAMIAAVDDGVGEIVQTLKDKGIYEDTVIFFSSDNGPSTESRNWLDGNEDQYYGGSAGRFRGHKGSLFDGGIREPSIMSYPKYFPQGRVVDEIGVMKDITPTFMELAKIESDVLPDIDGKSLVSMITNHAPSPHQEVFWEYDGQLAIRQGQWKLVLRGMLDMDREQPEEIHLSNLDIDPGEVVNLASRFPDVTSNLKHKVECWYEKLKEDMTSNLTSV